MAGLMDEQANMLHHVAPLEDLWVYDVSKRMTPSTK